MHTKAYNNQREASLSGENLRVLAAADYLNISASRLNKFRVYGGGPEFYKIGKIIIYNTADLDRWLVSHKRRSTSE